MGIFYATREQVKSSLAIAYTPSQQPLIDQKIDAASRAVEGLLRRRFYPERKTVTFDFPNYQYTDTWRLFLSGNELISIETLSSGGTTIVADDRFLRRTDDIDEPPYNVLEIDLASSAAFHGGTTFQRNISVLGLYGWNDTDTSIPHGSVGANINSSVTSLVINPSGGIYPVGVGSIVLIGTERLITTARSMSDTGQNLQSNMDDNQSDTIVDVTDGTVFAVGEVILLGAERMLIIDIAGNNLIVDRAFDGTVLQAHTSPVDIYAARTFTVRRGALGSTAASHTALDSVYAHEFPGLVNELCIAEATVLLEQNSAGYARVVGSGANARESAGQGLADIRALAVQAYGRKARLGAV